MVWMSYWWTRKGTWNESTTTCLSGGTEESPEQIRIGNILIRYASNTKQECQPRRPCDASFKVRVTLVRHWLLNAPNDVWCEHSITAFAKIRWTVSVDGTGRHTTVHITHKKYCWPQKHGYHSPVLLHVEIVYSFYLLLWVSVGVTCNPGNDPIILKGICDRAGLSTCTTSPCKSATPSPPSSHCTSHTRTRSSHEREGPASKHYVAMCSDGKPNRTTADVSIIWTGFLDLQGNLRPRLLNDFKIFPYLLTET